MRKFFFLCFFSLFCRLKSRCSRCIAEAVAAAIVADTDDSSCWNLLRRLFVEEEAYLRLRGSAWVFVVVAGGSGRVCFFFRYQEATT